jgi:polyhydroxyalkanoate synthesis regulator phasin
MQDAWRAYLELVLGVTEASRKKAREVAKELLGRGETTAAQLQSFVDDLVSTSRTNREALARLVRHEVDRAVGAVGLATAEEMAEFSSRLQELERRLEESGAGAAAPASTTTGGSPVTAPPVVPKPPVVAKPMAKKVVKKAVPKKVATPAVKRTAAPRKKAG